MPIPLVSHFLTARGLARCHQIDLSPSTVSKLTMRMACRRLNASGHRCLRLAIVILAVFHHASAIADIMEGAQRQRHGTGHDVSVGRQLLGASPRRGRHSRCCEAANLSLRASSTLLAFASPLTEQLSTLVVNNDPLFVWGLRLTSALVGYVGCLSYLDRPRGQLMQDADSLLEIKQSTVQGAGLGLFVGSATSIPKNTVLGTYPGVLLPLQKNLPKLSEHPSCETYIWRFSDSRYILDPTDDCGELQPDCTGGSRYSLPLSMALCKILTKPKPTMLCRVNEPPLGRDVNVFTTEDLDARTVTFVLERDVYPGEELFMDYGVTYDRSQYGGTS